ncbi:hypothetical protein WDW86_13240 [Bdellovibrionota bacterium FG-2]
MIEDVMNDFGKTILGTIAISLAAGVITVILLLDHQKPNMPSNTAQESPLPTHTQTPDTPESPKAPDPKESRPIQTPQTPVQNPQCLHRAFPGISATATSLSLSDLVKQTAPIPEKISLTIEVKAENHRQKQLWVAELKPKPRPAPLLEGSETIEPESESARNSPILIQAFDLTIEERPAPIAAQSAQNILDVFAQLPKETTIQIDERIFRTIGPEGTTIILRNGQIEHLILPPDFRSRCETRPDLQTLESSKEILPLICECDS